MLQFHEKIRKYALLKLAIGNSAFHTNIMQTYSVQKEPKH